MQQTLLSKKAILQKLVGLLVVTISEYNHSPCNCSRRAWARAYSMIVSCGASPAEEPVFRYRYRYRPPFIRNHQLYPCRFTVMVCLSSSKKVEVITFLKRLSGDWPCLKNNLSSTIIPGQHVSQNTIFEKPVRKTPRTFKKNVFFEAKKAARKINFIACHDLFDHTHSTWPLVFGGKLGTGDCYTLKLKLRCVDSRRLAI